MPDRSFSDRLALAAAQNIKERTYWLSRLSGDLVKAAFPYDYKKEEHQQQDVLLFSTHRISSAAMPHNPSTR